MREKFDFEAALKAIESGQSISGKAGGLVLLVKQLTEAALEGELESHLAEDVSGSRRNGRIKRMVKSTSGAFELGTPCDRAGTFELKLVKKHQRTASDEIGTNILSMFGLKMSYADTADHGRAMTTRSSNRCSVPLKHGPTAPPRRCASIEQARTWVAALMRWYNSEHQHGGIRIVTPAERHRVEDKATLVNRDTIYAAARKGNPQRWTTTTCNWRHIEIFESPDPE